jgi:hypothetical protein
MSDHYLLKEILDKLSSFEVRVTRMLHGLDERISSIERNFEQASQMASGLMEGSSFFSREDLESFKNTFTGDQNPLSSGARNAESLSDMMESLKGMTEKFASIKGQLQSQLPKAK